MIKKRVIVGSTNPAKVNGVREAVVSYWDDVEVTGQNTSSKVSTMPMSKQEIRFGAKSRAEFVTENYDTWLSVGNEGGAALIEGNWYLFGSTYITDGINSSWGGELQMRLPSEMIAGLNRGKIELGTVIDKMTNRVDVKKQEGAIGLLTQMRLTRSQVFKMSAMQALAYWYYSKEFQI